MNMKRFYTLVIACLCLLAIHGQNQNPNDGRYVFTKAELVINNYETKQEVERKIFTDTTLIDPYNLHLENTFREVYFEQGVLKECVLPDGKRYVFDEQMHLQPTIDGKAMPEDLMNMLRESALYAGKTLNSYVVSSEGNVLTISFSKYNFGQTDIDYTMQAELIVTMTKRENR